MLYFIITWTFLIIVCCLIGTTLLNVLKADSFERVGDRIIAAVWLGVVVLSISLLATSLVLPLSSLVGGVITVSISLFSLLSQRTRSQMIALKSLLPPNLILGFFTLEFAIATLTTRPVTWFDTGLYHYGAIQWLSEFGAVPGIALLRINFGYTSSWFALAAPLNAEIFDSRVSAVTNGFAFVIAMLHFLISLGHSFTSKAQLGDWLVVIFSLMVMPLIFTANMMSQILVSPSPDFPVIFFTEVVAWSILIVSNRRTPSLYEVVNPIVDGGQIIPLILSAGAVTIKLTTLPLLFISSLFYIFGRGFNVRRVLIGSVTSILLLSPMFAFGIVTSGCPLYPSSFLCLDLPWSLTAQESETVAEMTRGWGTWYGSPPPNAISGLWLLWQWFSSIKSNKVITLLIVISTLSAIPIVRTLTTSRISGQLWVLALGVLGITFMMLQSPHLRFGLGYLVLLPALSIAIYCKIKFRNILSSLVHRSTFYAYLKSRKVMLAASFLAALTIIISVDNGVQSRLLLPPQLPRVELLNKTVNDVTYFAPNNPPPGLCWAAKLPCALYPEKDIKLRDPARGIKAGFVRKK